MSRHTTIFDIFGVEHSATQSGESSRTVGFNAEAKLMFEEPLPKNAKKQSQKRTIENWKKDYP